MVQDQDFSIINEQEAIDRSLRGEVNAFNSLILKYQNMAFSTAYRMLQDENAAADAVQEGFIKAFRALSTFQGGNFKSWLMRIVINNCYDVLRSRQRQSTTSLDATSDDHEPVAYLVDQAEGPAAYVERMELNQQLEQGIRGLPADQRTVLVLCDVHGYSYEEIAEITGFPMGTVKSRINRARTKLRDFLLQKPELLPTTFRP